MASVLGACSVPVACGLIGCANASCGFTRGRFRIAVSSSASMLRKLEKSAFRSNAAATA